jgi:hypothetical protein
MDRRTFVKSAVAATAASALPVSVLAQTTAPICIGVDFPAVPTNATMSDNVTPNGRYGHGGYLTFYMLNPPLFGDWGVNSHITIGGVEVALYCSQTLVPCMTQRAKQPAVYGVRVQVGQLGGAVYGTPLDVAVTVGGVGLGALNQLVSGGTSYYNDLILGFDAPVIRSGFSADYHRLQVTPIKGDVIYVDPSAADNNGNGSWAQPRRNMQDSTSYKGGLRNNSSRTANDGTWPGTQIVARGGDYTPVGDNRVVGTNLGCWAYLFRITGTAPGTNWKQGPIAVTSYPGGPDDSPPNVNEIAHYAATSGIFAYDGFKHTDTTRAAEINGYDGTQGWCHQIHYSWLKVTAAPDGPEDCMPWDIDNGSNDCRISACEGTMVCLDTIARKGAGISGCGLRVRLFLNWLHDITAGDGNDELHGWYPDTAALAPPGGIALGKDYTIAFSFCANIGDGSGISAHNSGGSSVQQLIIYNNWITDCNKGSYTENGVKSSYTHTNVFVNSGEATHDMADESALAATAGSQFFHNTCVDFGVKVSTRSALWDQGGTGSGGTDHRNNIVFQRSTSPGRGLFTSLDNCGRNTLKGGTWWDSNNTTEALPKGTGAPNAGCSPPNLTIDTNGRVADPLFFNAAADNFVLTSSSPALNHAFALLTVVPKDFDYLLNPMFGTAWDDGAYERQQ